MAVFHPSYALAGLRGADYNPRAINDDALDKLRESLDAIGICKPIIVSGSLILAGHQRTRTLRAMGIETAPVILLQDVSDADERKFNQLHNGTDFDSGDEAARVPPSAKLGYEMASGVTGNRRAKMAGVRADMCRLLLTYGNWGACVATQSGEIIHAAQYALACLQTGIKPRVFRIPDALAERAKEMLGRQYGRFSYAKTERKSYVQTFAQPRRLRSDKQNGMASKLYPHVEAHMKPGMRLLDFGCGQADHVTDMRRRGFDAMGVEFWFRKGPQIDGAAVHRMIDAVARDLSTRGLFDVVVCDAVVNSTDSVQAEQDVMHCLNALCKPGGTIFFSGRPVERIRAQLAQTQWAAGTRCVECVDEDGLSAVFLHGAWFFQKYHTKDQALALAERYIGKPDWLTAHATGSTWQIRARNTVQADPAALEASLAREFNLPWPGGRSVGKAETILAAWRQARSAAPQTANSGTS